MKNEKRWVTRESRYDGKVCAECGSDGNGGAIQEASGKVWHFRKFPKGKLSKPLPIKCYGKFTKMVK